MWLLSSQSNPPWSTGKYTRKIDTKINPLRAAWPKRDCPGGSVAAVEFPVGLSRTGKAGARFLTIGAFPSSPESLDCTRPLPSLPDKFDHSPPSRRLAEV